MARLSIRLLIGTADTFATWLGDHPDTEMICWTAPAADAEAARTGAPEAIQMSLGGTY